MVFASTTWNTTSEFHRVRPRCETQAGYARELATEDVDEATSPSVCDTSGAVCVRSAHHRYQVMPLAPVVHTAVLDQIVVQYDYIGWLHSD